MPRLDFISETLQKLVIPLFVIAIVVIVGMSVVLQAQKGQLEQLHHELKASQEETAQQKSKGAELNQQLAGLQTQRKSLEERLTSLKTQLTSSSTDLEQARVQLQDLQDRYQRVEGERSKLQEQVAALTNERDQSNHDVQRLDQNNAELARSLAHMRERLAMVERDYRQAMDKLSQVESVPIPGLDLGVPHGTMSTPSVPLPGADASPANTSAGKPLASSSVSMIPGAVELPPIIVRSDQAGMLLTVRARVLEVNDPHNFVVLDKGSEDGVRVGMTFDLLRGAGMVGKATVVRVRPQLSACDVIRSKTPGPLQIGDIAVQSAGNSR